eukprot:359768-Chlamydomonas_euryale.AAC.2
MPWWPKLEFSGETLVAPQALHPSPGTVAGKKGEDGGIVWGCAENHSLPWRLGSEDAWQLTMHAGVPLCAQAYHWLSPMWTTAAKLSVTFPHNK